MVVNYFDFGGACIGPHEADAISFVDANTVLPPSISGQPFETVARGNSKIAQCGQHGAESVGYPEALLVSRHSFGDCSPA